MTPCLQALYYQVTEEMNIALLRDFTVEDIDDALKSMASIKSPGLDGFPEVFFFPKELEYCGGGNLPSYFGYTKFRLYAFFSKYDKYCTYPKSEGFEMCYRF